MNAKEDVAPGYEGRAAVMQKLGYTETEENAHCLRAFIGDPCGLDAGGTCDGHLAMPANTNVLDHARVFASADDRMIMADPYSANGADISELVALAERLGLKVRLNGASEYFPERAFTVTIQRRT